ncbi:hypothetical protein GWI33_015051 [Rhynchophorus ferrugineus]|uniref:Uncharacterized protein n=1 Tax=Rhynchophorus ferrugineus TaxID=354439 RepID=A0A834MBS9_RHYFE|nr:hypothetical protein GWI33_015051 [Rhynchophorus ferrugineus]
MTRIIFTLAFHTLLFSIEAIFVNVNTDNWQQLFFIITMIVLIMVMSTISFGAAGQFGLFSKLPPMYINAYLVGEGFAGMFNAVMRLISIVISPSPTGSAMIYFCTGSALMFISTILTVIAGKTGFFRYYNNSSSEDKKEKIRDRKELFGVVKHLRHMLLLNALFILAPLASIYNLVVSEYESDSNNVWANQYFVTVCTFLIPSIANTVGRLIFSKFNWDCPVPILYGLVIAYEIIPSIFVFLSNAQPRHHLPVLINHDWEYSMGMAIYFFFQGFIASMMLMKTIRMLPEKRVELGMLISMFFSSIASTAFSPLGVLAVKMI